MIGDMMKLMMTDFHYQIRNENNISCSLECDNWESGAFSHQDRSNYFIVNSLGTNTALLLLVSKEVPSPSSDSN